MNVDHTLPGCVRGARLQASVLAVALLFGPASVHAFSVNGDIAQDIRGLEDGLLIADHFNVVDGTQFGEAELPRPESMHLPSMQDLPVGRGWTSGGSLPSADFAAESSGLFIQEPPPGGGPHDYEIRSQLLWSASVAHQGTSPQDYELNLSIDPIELRLWDAADPPVTWKAGYRISVSVDGTSVWFSEAEIDGNMNGVSLSQFGTDLGATGVNLPAAGQQAPSTLIGYDFGSYAETISLATLNNQGDSFDLSVFVSAYIEDVPNTETGAYALIGDPDGGAPGINATVIPEPGTYALLGGVGALLLVLARRYGKRAKVGRPA